MKLTKVENINEIKIGKIFFVGFSRKTKVEVISKPQSERSSYKFYWEFIISEGICYKEENK